MLCSPGGLVIEMSPEGKVVWKYGGFGSPTSFNINKEGNKIIADKYKNIFAIINSKQNIIWQYTEGDKEYIEETFDGNYLIVSPSQEPSLMEIKPDKEVFKSFTNMPEIGEAHKLATGNYLLTSRKDNAVREIDASGKTVWETKPGLLKQPFSVQVLNNGNYLIADYDNHRIVEINRDSEVEWEFKQGLNHPIAARELPKGTYIVSDFDNNRVILMERNGKILSKIQNYAARNVTLLPNGNIGIAGVKTSGIFK